MMPGKNFLFVGAALILIAGVFVVLRFRDSQVSGVVKLNGTPIAAGSITFESDEVKVTGQVSDGQYEIRHPVLSGDFKVKIDVHFVRPEEAAAFYEHLTHELNQQKGNGETTQSAIKTFEFEEKLTRGSNRRDFRLTE